MHAFQGAAVKAAEKRKDTGIFALMTQAEHLYAVFGSHRERGGRPYWLLWCVKPGYKAPKGLKDGEGNTIRQGTWIIDAYWFTCTSDNQERRSYSLLKSDPVRAGELTHVPVGSLIQETDLEFDRAGMHDRIFGDASHLKVMRWNFSNVVT